jgi:pyruvate,water dikinase
MPYIESPEIYTKEDIPHVGGKAAHLAELIKAGFPVPECFFITVEAYNKFLEANALRAPILDTIAKTDFSSPDSLAEASKKIRTMIEQAEMPAEIRDAIIRAYRKLAGAPDPALRIELSGLARSCHLLPCAALLCWRILKKPAPPASRRHT